MCTEPVCEYCYERPAGARRWGPSRLLGLTLDVILLGMLLGLTAVCYSMFSLDNEWVQGKPSTVCASDDPHEFLLCELQNEVVSDLYDDFSRLQRRWEGQSQAQRESRITELWALYQLPDYDSADPPVDSLQTTTHWMRGLFDCVKRQPIAYRACEGRRWNERICRASLGLWIVPGDQQQQFVPLPLKVALFNLTVLCVCVRQHLCMGRQTTTVAAATNHCNSSFFSPNRTGAAGGHRT